MDILEKALRILEQPVCDHCLGRQFGQLLSGFSNAERGRMLRAAAAMAVDEERYKGGVDLSNFSGISFHNLEAKPPPAKECSVCGGFFSGIGKYPGQIGRNRKYNYRTFLVGTKLSSVLVEKEEALWERAGIDWCEPLKAEINREVGKLAEKSTGAKFSPRNPDVNIILDIENSRIEVKPNPLFIYGEYQKLKRGIPQTKWPSRKYRTSVEQIIAKPFMKASRGSGHKLHGMGREDIDARCLAWRPFVLELLQPKERDMQLKKLSKRIAPSVKVRNLRLSSIAEVRKIKETKADKTYRAVVRCKSAVSRQDMKKISSLRGEIRQKTPARVLHRRGDRLRKRAVREIKARYAGRKTFTLDVKAESGLYIKELISGDNGRTRPSVSEALGTECRCAQLDVVRIHLKYSR